MSKNKIIFSISLVAIVALSFWFLNLLKDTVIVGNLDSRLIVKTAIVFMVWLVAVAINLMMSFRFGGLLTAAALPVVFLMVFSFSNPVFLVAAVVAFVISLSGLVSAAREKSQRLKLGIASVKKGANAYFIATLIILTALSYQSIFADGQLKISEKNIQSLLPFVESQIKAQVPFYSGDMTTDEILVIMAISKQEITLSAKNFSPSFQKKIQAEIIKDPTKKQEDIMQDPEIVKLLIADIIKTNPKLVDGLRENYSQSLGIDIAKGQSLTATITDIANLYIEKMSAPFKEYLPIVFAVTIFFSFKAVEFIFVGIAVGIAGALFAILRSTGAVKISKKEAMQEIIES